MRSSNHKLHASFASSLPGAAGISAAVRRGKLEISNPIPISRYDLEGPDTRFDEARERLPPLTTSAKPDTWPRGSTRPALQDCNPPAGHAGLVLKSSGPHHNTNRASAALTSTYQSMSSVRSGNSVRKSGGIKAAFRRMFGSKRRRDTFSTGADGHRSVCLTDLQPAAIFYQHICNQTKLTNIEVRDCSKSHWAYRPSSVAKAIYAFRRAHPSKSIEFACAQCGLARTNAG